MRIGIMGKKLTALQKNRDSTRRAFRNVGRRATSSTMTVAPQEKVVYLVYSDQYAKDSSTHIATYSDTAFEAAFTCEAKALAFIEAKPRRNDIGPLCWRMEELPLDPPSVGPK